MFVSFFFLFIHRARPCHHIKLMLFGYAARGKTTLLQKITETGLKKIENWAQNRSVFLNTKMPYNYSSNFSRYSQGACPTDGIVINNWICYKRLKQSQTALKSITFMTWDFGGQEEYYATHQCFLSQRSLYLVVWNVTHGMKGAHEIKPWLLDIQVYKNMHAGSRT